MARADGELQSYSDDLQVRRTERLLRSMMLLHHGRVSMANRGSIISEQELHGQFLVGLCVGSR